MTKSRKTLVRTLFFYGNYDDRSSAPSFDVVYDGKHRDNVVFTNVSQLNNRAIFISEVIYFPASEDISVCLIRTSKSDVPFISSIEVYGLDADMYDGVGPDEGLLRRNLDLYGFKNVKRYELALNLYLTILFKCLNIINGLINVVFLIFQMD